MTALEALTLIRDSLAEWTQTIGGSAAVAGDVAELFGLLATRPGKVRAIVMIDREAKRGEYEETGAVDVHLLVVISRGRGFAREGSQVSGADPLITHVEAAREVLRSIDFPADETEVTIDYQGYRPFAWPTADPVDAYQLECSIGSQLPAIESVET